MEHKQRRLLHVVTVDTYYADDEKREHKLTTAHTYVKFLNAVIKSNLGLWVIGRMKSNEKYVREYVETRKRRRTQGREEDSDG